MFYSFEELVGQTFDKVENKDDEELIFYKKGQPIYKFYHEQDCCEWVTVDDIDGDLSNLEGVPILEAEEVSSDGILGKEHDSSYTWTFYKFRTEKGYVTVKWYGFSNGYYSEEVNFCKL